MSSVGRADNVALTCVDTHSCAMEFRSKIAEPTSLHTDLSLVPTPANLKDLTGGTAGSITKDQRRANPTSEDSTKNAI